MSDLSLKTKIQEETHRCIKEKNTEKLAILRAIQAEIKQYEIDKNKREPLNDSQVLALIQKMIKQREQAIELFQKGGREDLVKKEEAEIQQLKPYLPAPLSEAEIEKMIEQAISETGAKTIADMGKVMAFLKDKLQGRANMGQVNQRIKKRLQ
jgi:uncharacterized protein